MKPTIVLRDFFGYQTFKGSQESIIQSVLDGSDVIALMPTGAGKSVCYQVPAMVLPGLTLVLSPLIALMKDQVDALNNLGIPAAYINSSQGVSEQRFVTQQVLSGKIKLLYAAPERLFAGTNALVDLLKQAPLSLVAIDEAHCVSQWGHDFRPEYLKVGELRRLFTDIPFMALTATADRQTRNEIAEKLALRQPKWFVSSFDRPNISYHVTLRSDAFQKLVGFLSQRKGDSGIIYCLSRKGVEDLSEKLQAFGFEAVPYHAGLESHVRERHQEMFTKDEVKIVVATIAFGMGIDKSNVRFVVHMNMPQNIESYYQETGRAGRDGLPSEALLFYSFGDSVTLGRMLEKAENPEHVAVMKRKLDIMVRFCQVNTCRRKFLLDYFGEVLEEDCGNCDNCFKKGQFIDATIHSQMLLSTVARLKEAFGLGYVILVLRGSQSAKIQEGHKSLSVYGVGKDKPEAYWKKLGNLLVQEGYLELSGSEYPTLSLTSLAWDRLKSKEKIRLPMEEEIHAPVGIQSPHDRELLEKLKQLRFSLARKENVPPYIIFSDASLMEMAVHYPADTASFRRIHGVGQVKAERYGGHFTRVIANYMAENGKIPVNAANQPVAKARKPSMSDTLDDTLALHRKGLSPFDIAAQRGFALSTVESHLIKLIELDRLDAGEFLAKDEEAEIIAQFETYEDSYIKPLKEFFGEKYSYFQLRAAIVGYHKKKLGE